MEQLTPTVFVDVTDKEVVIKLDISGPGFTSKSGKSKVYATTSGNKSIQGGFVLGLNLYKAI